MLKRPQSSSSSSLSSPSSTTKTTTTKGTTKTNINIVTVNKNSNNKNTKIFDNRTNTSISNTSLNSETSDSLVISPSKTQEMSSLPTSSPSILSISPSTTTTSSSNMVKPNPYSDKPPTIPIATTTPSYHQNQVPKQTYPNYTHDFMNEPNGNNEFEQQLRQGLNLIQMAYASQFNHSNEKIQKLNEVVLNQTQKIQMFESNISKLTQQNNQYTRQIQNLILENKNLSHLNSNLSVKYNQLKQNALQLETFRKSIVNMVSSNNHSSLEIAEMKQHGNILDQEYSFSNDTSQLEEYGQQSIMIADDKSMFIENEVAEEEKEYKEEEDCQQTMGFVIRDEVEEEGPNTAKPFIQDEYTEHEVDHIDRHAISVVEKRGELEPMPNTNIPVPYVQENMKNRSDEHVHFSEENQLFVVSDSDNLSSLPASTLSRSNYNQTNVNASPRLSPRKESSKSPVKPSSSSMSTPTKMVNQKTSSPSLNTSAHTTANSQQRPSSKPSTAKNNTQTFIRPRPHTSSPTRSKLSQPLNDDQQRYQQQHGLVDSPTVVLNSNQYVGSPSLINDSQSLNLNYHQDFSLMQRSPRKDSTPQNHLFLISNENQLSPRKGHSRQGMKSNAMAVPTQSYPSHSPHHNSNSHPTNANHLTNQDYHNQQQYHQGQQDQLTMDVSTVYRQIRDLLSPEAFDVFAILISEFNQSRISPEETILKVRNLVPDEALNIQMEVLIKTAMG